MVIEKSQNKSFFSFWVALGWQKKN
jgi:hypothetical protein